MKKWLATQFLLPHKNIYKLIEHLNQKRNLLLPLIFIAITIYPACYFLYIKSDYQNEIEKQQLLEQNIQQQNKVYHTLLTRINQLNKTDGNITKINTQLQDIAQQHQVNIENIQWSMDNGKQILFTAKQQPKLILEMISSLNAAKNLKIKELSLVKLNENRLIQLNITLIPHTTGENDAK